jgi:membrane-associated phospholipid phosphatase
MIAVNTVFVWAQDGQLVQDKQSAQEPPASQGQQSTGDTQPSQGQKPENPPEPESHGTRLRWQDIPKNVLHDEAAIFTSPFRINRQNAKWWILFGGATATFIGFDEKINNALPETTFLTTPSRWTSRIGADYSIYPIWATFYFVGKATDSPRARDTGRIGIQALLDAEIAVTVLKLATQRPRPEHQKVSLAFFTGGDAFPSGHSIKSWTLARVAAREYSEKKIVPILAYSAATAVSVSRFGGRRHSISDAVAGAAMGFFIGDYVYRHHHAPSEQSKAITWIFSHVDFNFSMGREPAMFNSQFPLNSRPMSVGTELGKFSFSGNSR